MYVLVVLDIAEEHSPAVLDFEDCSRAALDLENGFVERTDCVVERVIVVIVVAEIIVVLDNFVDIVV